MEFMRKLQIGGPWPVVKNVAPVCVALASGNRRAIHPQAAVVDVAKIKDKDQGCPWTIVQLRDISDSIIVLQLHEKSIT
jgi:hypothetical protein